MSTHVVHGDGDELAVGVAHHELLADFVEPIQCDLVQGRTGDLVVSTKAQPGCRQSEGPDLRHFSVEPAELHAVAPLRRDVRGGGAVRVGELRIVDAAHRPLALVHSQAAALHTYGSVQISRSADLSGTDCLPEATSKDTAFFQQPRLLFPCPCPTLQKSSRTLFLF